MHKKDHQVSKIRHEAAKWCLAVSGDSRASQEEKARFAEWITRSPQHLREYAAIEALWNEAAGYGEELRRDTRVVSLFGAAPQVAERAPVRRLVFQLLPLAVALAVVFFVGTIWLASDGDDILGNRPAVYRTMKGEMRVISLADGSVMHLNTLSTARVSYEKTERRIRLDRGQAFFAVRPDSNRPFIVATNTAEVEALGTGFDVKAFGRDLAVTVVEGEVVIRRAVTDNGERQPAGRQTAKTRPENVDDAASDKGGWSANLRANQQLLIPAEMLEGLPQPKRVFAHAETAWRENKLIFDGDPLYEVVADFNRYNKTQIIVLDEEIRSLRVSGTFDPRDPESFAQTISAVAELEVKTGLENNLYLNANTL